MVDCEASPAARVPNGGSLHGGESGRGEGTAILVIAIGPSPIQLITAEAASNHTLSTFVSLWDSQLAHPPSVLHTVY